MRKKFWLGAGLFIVLFIGFGFLSEFSFTPSGAVPGDVRTVITQDTVYGKAILFEEPDRQVFGIAPVKSWLGFFYRSDGYATEYMVEDKPFEAQGYGKDQKDHFLVGIQTATGSNIRYIAIGNHVEGQSHLEPYSLALDEVRANPDTYHLQEVEGNYALFVFDKYTMDNWTFRAFDQDGRLVADKLPGASARYIDWPELPDRED